MYTRRKFLKTGSALLAGSILYKHTFAQKFYADKLSPGSIGVQLFTIPKLLEKDFAGTMEMLAKIGYKEIEFYGPYPFSAPEAVERWKSLTPQLGFSGSGYFGQTILQVKDILQRNGLSTPSMHTDLVTLKTRMGQLAEAAHTLGQKYVVLPSYTAQADLDAYKRLADDFNEIGQSAAKEGIRFAVHNHGAGLKEINGQIPLKLILDRTDPKFVAIEMDIYWMTAGGADLLAYLDDYPGRFRLMHVKDMKEQVHFKGDGGDPKQWMELFPYMTDAGSGVLNLKAILSHAKKAGVQHFLVEHDTAANPDEALQKSYRYLSNVQLEG